MKPATHIVDATVSTNATNRNHGIFAHLAGELGRRSRNIIGMGLLTVALGALLALFANLLLQALVSYWTERRETSLNRAKLAAEAFGEFYAVISLSQSLNATHLNWKNGFGENIDPTDFANAINALNASRGRLAAIASPAVVAKLSDLERNGDGLTSETRDSRQTLTDVLALLRKDLGVADGANNEDLLMLLFGRKE
jgi:hypothetical protein